MEVNSSIAMLKKPWVAPVVVSSAPERGALLLVCSPTTQWDCDFLNPGCCAAKTSDILADCDNDCGSP